MKNKIAILTLAIIAIFGAGCATGSNVITGRARPMTSPAAVKIYAQLPPGAEVIGSVTSSNPNGFSHMSGGDEKVLKEEAAKIGANGLIIGSSDYHVGHYETTGLAIWVP